ncbi:nucleosome assembly protein 1-like 1 [Rhopilema esculentum]|uniref:nucleosome assembly protein 1-like 1 n=1 Tax=Rhopilema esculentum TaxID=499914 RepID=UPI0031DC621C
MPKGKKPVVDSSDGDDADAPSFNEQAVAHALATNPALMEAVQNKLNGLVGAASGYIESLPASVKRRVNALKNIQVEYAHIEGKFYKEVHALEMKYAEVFKPLYDKRKSIVAGEYEPTDEEAIWVDPSGEDEDEEKAEEEKKDDDNTKVKENKSEAEKLAEELKEKVDLDEDKKEEDVKGINEFWLTAMKNVELLSEMIQPHDEPILGHLTDIKLIFSGKEDAGEEEADDELGFAIEFHFSPNEYFSNSVLTKSYKVQCHPSKEDPFSFEGTEITGCTGCSIDWKKGKNVTQKTIKKKQKHKGRGQTRTITKTVKNDSFFNFFAPPEVDDEEEEMEEDMEALLAADFELGHFFRERLIPRAILYFTGEAIDEDDDDDFEGSDGDEGDDEELDDDEDPDFVPQPGGDKPAECKQQ